MIRLSVVLLLSLCAVPAMAQSKLTDVKKGKELYASCQPGASEAQKSYLDGYVMGTADASMGKYLCPKEAVSTQQIVDAFCKYLEAHPKFHNRQAGILLGLTFSETWPCK